MSQYEVEVLTEETIYPEDDHHFEGTVNGTHWEADVTVDNDFEPEIEALFDGETLTDEEEQAVHEEINSR